jgi:AraC-like DNA-binding protein
MKLFDITSTQGFYFDWGDMPHQSFKGVILPGSSVHSIHGGFGNMVFQMINRPNFDIWFSNYQIIRRLQSHSRADVRMIELSFLLLNNIAYELRHGKVRQKQWQFNLMNSQSMDSKVHFEKDSYYTTLDFHVREPLLEALVLSYPETLTPFLESVYQNVDANFFDKPLFATFQMIQIIEIITHLISQPVVNGMMLDLSVSLLFGFAISCKMEMASSKFRYDRKQEIEYQLNSVLAMMLSDLSSFRGVPFYAREAGMSETRFKEHFNREFGSSPKARWQKERLLHCYSEVVSTNKTFESIAEDHGFADHASFTKAFKNEFHFPPIFYRKSLSQNSQ